MKESVLKINTDSFSVMRPSTEPLGVDKKTIGHKPDCFSLSLRERLSGGEGALPSSLSHP